MKLIKIIFLSLFLVFINNSCDKNENFSISDPVNSFKLNEPAIGNIYLNFSVPENPAFSITWDDDLTGATSYTIEFSTDYGFTNPVLLGTSMEKMYTVSVEYLNEVLSSSGVTAYSNYPIYIRVKANDKISNVIVFNVNTYPQEDPLITSPDNGTSVTLSMDTPDDTVMTVYWEDPSISDASTVSVVYTIEIDLTGNDFANVRLLGETNEMSLAVTHDALNQAALTIGVEPEVATDVDVRVKAVIETTAGPIVRYSDPLIISLTAYANYPDLFLIGNATSEGWNNNGNNHYLFKDPYQNGHYVYTGYFEAGMIKLLEVKGQWQPQWGKGDAEGKLAGNPATQTTDPDVITVNTAGYYTFDVNLVDLTYSLTPYNASSAPVYSTMGILGHATPTGWGSHTAMTQSSFNPHIWYINSIHLSQDDGGDCDCGFKFRVDDTWNPNWGGEQNPPTLNYGVAVINGKNIGVPEEGYYMVFFNDLDGRYMYILN